jgi:ketosteroid isomerase-like protein
MGKLMTTRGAFLICIAFCSAIQSQPNSAEAEIRAARQASNAAIQHRDIAAFASSLADDFVMIRGNGGLVPSRQAYIEVFGEDFANPKAIRYQRVADKIEISKAAPLAAEHGHWVGTLPDGTQAYGGTYMAMWRRAEAGWKIRSELFVVLFCNDEPSCAGYRKP